MGKQVMKHLLGCLRRFYKNHVDAEIPEKHPENQKTQRKISRDHLTNPSHSAGLLPLQTGNPS